MSKPKVLHLVDVILSCDGELGTTDNVVDIEVAIIRRRKAGTSVILAMNMNTRSTFRWAAAPGQDVIVEPGDQLVVEGRVKGHRVEETHSLLTSDPNSDRLMMSVTFGGLDSIYRPEVLEASSRRV